MQHMTAPRRGQFFREPCRILPEVTILRCSPAICPGSVWPLLSGDLIQAAKKKKKVAPFKPPNPAGFHNQFLEWSRGTGGSWVPIPPCLSPEMLHIFFMPSFPAPSMAWSVCTLSACRNPSRSSSGRYLHCTLQEAAG